MATAPVSHGSSVTADISYTDLYARWERGNWSATEIDFSQDKIDWHERMTERAARRARCGSTTSSSTARTPSTDGLSPYIDAAPARGAEVLHRHAAGRRGAPQRLLQALHGRGRRPRRRHDGRRHAGDRAPAHLGPPQGLRALEEMAVALRKDQSLEQLCRGDHALPRRHRGHARAAGAALSWRRFIEEMDILPGFREGIRNVALDEQRHIAFGVKLLADAYQRGPRDGHARGQRRDPRGRPVHLRARQAARLGRRLLRVLRLHLRRARLRGHALARVPAQGDRARPERARRASRSRWTCRSRSARSRGTKMLKANLIGPDRPVVRDPEAVAIMFDAIRRQAEHAMPSGPGRHPVGLHRLRALVPDAVQRAHGRQAGHAGPLRPAARLQLRRLGRRLRRPPGPAQARALAAAAPARRPAPVPEAGQDLRLTGCDAGGRR